MNRRSNSRQSQKFIRRRQGRVYLISGLTIISLISWIVVLSRLSWLPIFTIDSVAISGADKSITDELRYVTSRELEGSYLKIFSKSNTLLYPRRRIVQAVKMVSPRIDSVKVERRDTNTLQVKVKEKVPTAIVCIGLPDFVEGKISRDKMALEKCFMADEEGFIFRKFEADQDTIGHNLYYIPEQTEIPGLSHDRIGTYATTTVEFGLLQFVYKDAKTNNIDVKSILIKEGGEYEAYIANPSSGINELETDDAVIYFNNDSSLALQFANLILFWNHVSNQRSKTERPSYEYIELRHSPNVFYREIIK